jgi:lysophospholipase L1-like esterase
VLGLHPDVVVIGFGMNDSGVPGYRDKDMISDEPAPLSKRAADIARDLELYKLLHYVAQLSRFQPRSIGDYLRSEASKNTDPVDYSAMEAWTRVSPKDYEANLREMIALARGQGASAVLLDNELWDGSPYRPLLRRIAESERVPLVDSYQLLADARRKVERDLEDRLHLHASDAAATAIDSGEHGMTTVIFRVYRGAAAVPRALSIAGNDAKLGAFEPNTVLMHDDGADGDERAGDGVWSYRVTLPAGFHLFYVYTNSGARGRWEGLDVPHIREIGVPASIEDAPVYLPVETFGRVYMQADNWHTDAAGYDLIAAAVADAVRNTRVSGLNSQVSGLEPAAAR